MWWRRDMSEDIEGPLIPAREASRTGGLSKHGFRAVAGLLLLGAMGLIAHLHYKVEIRCGRARRGRVCAVILT